jgi:hypothetical protein
MLLDKVSHCVVDFPGFILLFLAIQLDFGVPHVTTKRLSLYNLTPSSLGSLVQVASGGSREAAFVALRSSSPGRMAVGVSGGCSGCAQVLLIRQPHFGSALGCPQ